MILLQLVGLTSALILAQPAANVAPLLAAHRLQEVLHRIDRHLREQNLSAAAELLAKAEQEWPDAPELAVRAGNVALLHGNLDNAALFFELAAHHEPKRVDLWLTLARIDEVREKFAWSLRWLQGAQNLMPGDLALAMRMAEVAWAAGESKQAADQSERAQIDPRFRARAHRVLGHVAYADAKLVLAFRHWLQAFEAGLKDEALFEFCARELLPVLPSDEVTLRLRWLRLQVMR